MPLVGSVDFGPDVDGETLRVSKFSGVPPPVQFRLFVQRDDAFGVTCHVEIAASQGFGQKMMTAIYTQLGGP